MSSAAVAEARKLRIPFMPTLTNASQLNPIETRSRKIRRWAFIASNYNEGGGAKETLRLAIRRLNRINRVTNSRPEHRW